MGTADKGKYNKDNNIFLKYAHWYDSQLNPGSKASFFDENGNLRTSWGAKNKDYYMQGPKSPTTTLEDRINSIRND